MKENNGVFQMENGYWGYRFVITVDGKRIDRRKTKDEFGNRYKTAKQARKAREHEIVLLQNNNGESNPIIKRTVEEVFDEYCCKGRSDKAYGTIRKQDSLWNNHLKAAFGSRLIDSLSVAEINDYLAQLYYLEGRSFGYVEAFLKMFYLLLGQAYSRNYIEIDKYNKLCVNKNSRIRMPKRKINDEDETIIFSKEQMSLLDAYFKNTNAETAYLLGKYCGLRINECYGLKWDHVNLKEGTLLIDRQMQYQNGVIKLVPVKTRNAKRIIYISSPLQQYLTDLFARRVNFETEYSKIRAQKKTTLCDIDGKEITSLDLINSLPNGKIQTVNSMKFHTRKIKEELNMVFKYHYLRHTYGTRLAEMNTPTHILCNQMGHASSKVTERYYLTVSKSGVDVLLDNLNMI